MGTTATETPTAILTLVEIPPLETGSSGRTTIEGFAAAIEGVGIADGVGTGIC